MFKKFINKSVVGIFLLANLIVSSYTIAEEQTSISFGELSQNLTTDIRLAITKENSEASIVDQHIGKATGKTRTEILENKISKTTSFARSNSYNNYADFAIYGATTLLQDDYDGDGFYQTFSVSFDADIYSYTPSQLGEVYALLYISKNGGPWTHYYTTDNFLIEGDSDLDEYEVITTFLSGYSADHYDILIDLYQVGYSDIVASYSADDSNALYALPLESADYDEPYIEYIEVIEISHGGSFSIVILLLFLFIYSVRTVNRKY
ncbi:choice-of-anchor H family protein [Candidatus Colwellia aromaticivorans]|uniref:choice-of-anchor H family protein n=1 Tax=Candidatus Colwellia aromaticivorans TaxID=2267621 RepID=UPI0014444749|nr:choice-of-anchor H family protein [Candidatus Colwellia aromaticivorans]